jgi:uncharacterized protein
MTLSALATEAARSLHPADVDALEPSVEDFPPPGQRLETLYHGTSQVSAELIHEVGLRPRPVDGRVFFTSSKLVAQCYAEGAAVRHSALFGEPVDAVILEIPADGARPFQREANSMPPPLFWETQTCAGEAFFREDVLPASAIAGAFRWTVEALTVFDRERLLDEVARSSLTTSLVNTPVNEGSPPNGRVYDVIPEPRDLLVASSYRNHRHPVHGWSHALEVAAAGIRLLEGGASEADPAVLLAFAILHDSQRFLDGHDPDHGRRAADVAGRLAGDCHWLSQNQIRVLRSALVAHDRGQVSPDPTVGACWDADRLTLSRVGIKPDPGLMSTWAGKRLASGVDPCIPDLGRCDWCWVRTRYNQMSHSGEEVSRWLRRHHEFLEEGLHTGGSCQRSTEITTTCPSGISGGSFLMRPKIASCSS